MNIMSHDMDEQKYFNIRLTTDVKRHKQTEPVH